MEEALDSGLAFEESGLCQCIYIALDRQVRTRKGQGTAEREDERELIYARRMAERGRRGNDSSLALGPD